MKTLAIAGIILILGGAYYAYSSPAPQKPYADTNAPNYWKQTGPAATNSEKAVKLTAPPNNPGRLYLDQFISMNTPKIDSVNSEGWRYGVGVGYQVSKHWAIDARVSHAGFDTEDHLVQDIGGRVAARLPWKFLSPGVFLGATFDLEDDTWHLNPGASVELGVNRRLKGLSVFTEIGMDSKLRDGTLVEPGWKLTGGLRWRF